MPTRGPRVLGCGCTLSPGLVCSHQRKAAAERKARADAQRPTARERGYDSKWERERAAFLLSRPRCERVIDGRPCNEPATLVHHLEPHRGDRKLFWSRSNWSPRCRPCHDRAEQSAERRAAR